jgi:hypothetical protein
MATTTDWRRNREAWVRLLERRTGVSLAAWNRRVKREAPAGKTALRQWLAAKGVTGYGQMILVMERYGYPEFMTATASQLIDAQYAGQPRMRALAEAIVKAASRLGDVTIQARKTFVALVSPVRTFARLHPAKGRIVISLRLEGRRPGGRLERCRYHDTTPVQVSVESRKDLDAEVMALLRAAYEENS